MSISDVHCFAFLGIKFDEPCGCPFGEGVDISLEKILICWSGNWTEYFGVISKHINKGIDYFREFIDIYCKECWSKNRALWDAAGNRVGWRFFAIDND